VTKGRSGLAARTPARILDAATGVVVGADLDFLIEALSILVSVRPSSVARVVATDPNDVMRLSRDFTPGDLGQAAQDRCPPTVTV
jgi:hypothetical protein